jgi:hypothetical protein
MRDKAAPNRKNRRLRHGIVLGAGYFFCIALPASVRAAPPCPPQTFSVDGGTVVSGSKECPTMTTQSDTPDYPDPVKGVTLLSGRTTTNAANASALMSALSSAACGTDIRLASGTFAGNFTMSKSCPANNPVRIVGAAQFASTLTGTFTLRGAQNILAGIQFSGQDAKVVCQGTNNKVLANKFTLWKNGAAIRPDSDSAFGKQCEVAYNEIYTPGAWTAGATASTGNQRRGIQMNTSGDGRGSTAHLGAWVHHNYLHDFPNKPDASDFHTGDSDAMEIGESGYDWSPILSTGWYIEDNLIENHLQAGQAAVDLKVGGVVFRRNTLKRSPNTRFDMRFGSNQIFESNWNDTGGGTWHGENNSAFCNYFAGEVKLKSGSAGSLDDTNSHAGTYNTHLAKNDFGNLVVGHFSSTAEKAFPATLTRIEEHDGSISLANETNTTNNARMSSDRKCAPPHALDASDVGPAAMSSASSAYRAARMP